MNQIELGGWGKKAYQEVASYQDSLNHPVIREQGVKTLDDSTEIIVNRIQAMSYRGFTKTQTALGVHIGPVYFEITRNGLMQFIHGEKTVSWRSVLEPGSTDNLSITYEGANQLPALIRYRAAARLLVNWLKSVDQAGNFIESPVSIVPK